jgi:hypothetical protein
VQQGAFSDATETHDGHHLCLVDVEIHSPQYLKRLAIGEQELSVQSSSAENRE